VEFELERTSPLDPKRVVYDTRLVKRDRVTRRATIALRLIRRDLLDEILDHCKSCGFKLAALQIAGGSGERPWSGFPINRYAAARLRVRRWSMPLLAGLALILIGGVVTTEYMNRLGVEHAINAEVDTERKRASAIRNVRTQIETTASQITFFASQRKAPLFVALLTDLSGLLPDSAWATEVELSHQSVRIHGNAKTASSLIDIFEKSQRFSNARFQAPLTRGPAGDSERFDLSVDIESAL
jgi:hypothetical protein